MMSKSSGLKGLSRMPAAKLGLTPEASQDDDTDGDENDSGYEDDHASKLVALQDILNNIHQLTSDDLKPYIEDAQRSMHLKSMEKDMPGMGMHDEPDGDEGVPMPPAHGGMDVTIGIGGGKLPKSMKSSKLPESDEDEDDELPKKGGFMAILAKKIKSKK